MFEHDSRMKDVMSAPMANINMSNFDSIYKKTLEEDEGMLELDNDNEKYCIEHNIYQEIY